MKISGENFAEKPIAHLQREILRRLLGASAGIAPLRALTKRSNNAADQKTRCNKMPEFENPTPLSPNKDNGFTGQICKITNICSAPYGFTGRRGERHPSAFPGQNEMPLPNMPLPKLPFTGVRLPLFPSPNKLGSHPCSSVKSVVKQNLVQKSTTKYNDLSKLFKIKNMHTAA
ncbi:MAG: hypothetical protein JWM16_5867 [Verrucomicrobiales bacterium]|nr:hypothetical protein [Verrucomicrobiales bacterium]